MTTDIEHSVMAPEVARTITDRIKVAVEATWQLVIEAYQGRAWLALGYSSWDDYCTREFGSARLRLPREERQEVVMSLRDAGLSIRAITAATGDSKSVVARALSGVPNGTPDEPDLAQSEPPDGPDAVPVTGRDGKSYPRKATDRAERHEIHRGARRLDPVRIIDESVKMLDGIASGLDLIEDIKSVDAEKRFVWLEAIREPLRAINRFAKELRG